MTKREGPRVPVVSSVKFTVGGLAGITPCRTPPAIERVQLVEATGRDADVEKSHSKVTRSHRAAAHSITATHAATRTFQMDTCLNLPGLSTGCRAAGCSPNPETLCEPCLAYPRNHPKYIT